MSAYPRFSRSSGVFNSKDIVGAEEGLTTVSLDLSGFVQRNAPTFDAPLYLGSNSAINFGGKVQSVAFDDTEKSTNDTNKGKLTNVEYDGTSTKVSGSFDLRDSDLLITDEIIPINKITNLNATLTGIQDNLNNITSNDSDILDLQTEDTAQKNRLTDLESLTVEHTNEIDVIENDILSNQVDIATNLASINTHTTNLSDNLTKINDNKTEIEANDADILSIQTNITQVEADIVTNLTTFNDYKVLNDSNIVTIENDITSNDTDIINIQNDIVSLETITTAHTNDIDTLETLTAAQTVEIDNIKTLNTTQTSDITALETLTSLHTGNLTTLDASTASNLSEINDLITQQGLNNTSISTLNTDIATKQSNLNSTNRLNASFVGNGDLTNNKLSSLNDISTTISVQTQLNTLTTSLSVLDGLQDLDLVNIPVMQSDISTLQAETTTNSTNIASNQTAIATKQNIIDTDNKLNTSLLTRNDNLQHVDVTSSIDTSLTNIQSGVTTNSTGIVSLVNSDTLHASQIADLTSADTLLQSNIDLKQNIISLTNKLNTNVIFDTSLNESLNNILDTIDTNISTLNINKQNKITSSVKLDSSLLDMTTTPLQYVDITSNLKVQLTNITNSINTLQSLQNGDVTSFQTISDNFDTLELTKLDKSVYDDTITPQITSILASISTLQGLQDGDVVSFASINNSLTNLTNTKHPLIDNSNKLNSSLLTRDDNLQHVDVSSSIDTSLTTLQTNIDTKQDIVDVNNKIPVANVDISGSALNHVDITGSLTTSLNNINTSINNLNSYDVSQTAINTANTTQLNTQSTDISTLTAFDTAQTTVNTSVQASITDLETFETAQGVTNTSVQASITDLETFETAQGVTNTALQSSITDLETFETAQGVTNTALQASITDLETFETAQGVTNTALQSSITDLETFETAQGVTNTALQSGITDLETFETAQGTTNTALQSSITDLETFETAQGVTNTAQGVTNASVASTVSQHTSDITALQSGSSKIEPIDNSLAYTTPTNILTHTYNEENIFLNLLDDNNVITLDLTITSPANYKSYTQTVIVDCLEFKGYIHTLNINGSPVEIKYKGGDGAINLAPIAGYSTLIQTFNMTRMNDTWHVMSDIKLFYNSNSNSVYDVTPPIITLIGSANINYEINSGAYTDAGATANDNIGGDLTGSIVMDASAVDVTTLGSYNVSFNCVDGAGNNAIQKIRVINVIDSTNPVVVITGDIEKTQNVGDPYVEEGATASDNSNESLTVVITGTIDINTSNDYTLTYTATDSSGNVHALTRLVHVIAGPILTLKYSNPTTDIISGLIGFSSYLNATPTSTQETFTISGNADAYKNGDYKTECSNYHYDTGRGFNFGFAKCLDNNATGAEFFAPNVTGHGYYYNLPINHHVHGTLTMTNDSYRDTGSGYNYYGCNTNEIGLYHLSTTATNATTYNGEYMQITFPFYLELNKIDIYMGDAGYLFREAVMLGSVNDGATWEYIITVGNGSAATAYDIPVVTTLKYKTFRMVITQAEVNQGRMYMMRTFKLYGDVYN